MKVTNLFLSVVAMVATCAMAAEARTKVVIGQLDWTGATAIEEVLAQVMTKYLDADVGTIHASVDAILEAMNKGDGTVDIEADFWGDHLPAAMRNYILPGSKETILLNDEPYFGTEGYFVPAYTRDMVKITKLADLADPTIAKAFDTDGDGKGEIWAGAPGWESVSHAQVRAKSYGFDSTMEIVDLDQPVFLARLKDLYERKAPIVFYYWTPEWIFAKYDLVKLEEPAFTGYTTDEAKGTDKYNPQGCYTFVQPSEGNDWLDKSTITCDQPPSQVNIAYSRALSERAPEIGRFLKQTVIKAEWLYDWIYAIDVEGKSAADVAKAWIEANRETVEKVWLAGIDIKK